MRHLTTIGPVLSLLLTLGCPGETHVSNDAGPHSDAALTDTGASDTSQPSDAARTDTRAGDTSQPSDAARTDTRADDAAGQDAALPDQGADDLGGGNDASAVDQGGDLDAGGDDAAAGDAATGDADEAVDSGALDGSGPGADAGLPPQGPELVVNGSFESWTADLPDGWVGAETNLPAASIVEDSSTAHDGLRSCQLINPDSSHKRFTTAPTSAAAGRYHLSYWVRGGGEIRNARYVGDYSSYSSYTVVDSDQWQEIRYDFSLTSDVTDVFELVFSVRNTVRDRDHLRVDHVRLSRDIEPCDAISCDTWQVCDNAVASCVSAPGFCADLSECADWQDCDAAHRCVPAVGRCAATVDCDEPTPVCDVTSHLCVEGDPCAGVECDPWKTCDPDDASCVLLPDRCLSTADCLGHLPVCDVSTHTCEAVDHAANVVPNGGFEAWEEVWLGGPTSTTFHLPVSWYGVCDGCSPYYPTSEQDPNDLAPYTHSVHGGLTAVQLIKAGQPADRFVSEPFAVTPTTTYSCAYWVRGQGSHRQRAYCGGWRPDTEYLTVDSDAWQQVTFELSSDVSWCVLILYASNTDAARDHVQIDDVVCSRKFPN